MVGDVHDRFDRAILMALQQDGSLTNAALSLIVHLSPSQCSRRRAALEEAGVIQSYAARLNARALGFAIRAYARVNLHAHGRETDEGFARFVNRLPQVRSAHSVSGDADYVLDIHVRDLEELADFIHRQLLAHPQVAQVRSEIVLRTAKEDGGLTL